MIIDDSRYMQILVRVDAANNVLFGWVSCHPIIPSCGA